jgi:PAS domain S-box-containing protein
MHVSPYINLTGDAGTSGFFTSGMVYKILAIALEQPSREFIEEFLDHPEIDFQVQYADAPERAMAAIIHERPDIILLDADPLGHELYETIRQIHQHETTLKIPVCILTTCQTPELLNNIIGAGAIDIVLKPLNHQDFNNCLHQAVEIINSYRQIEMRIQKTKEDIHALEKLMNTASNMSFAFVVFNADGELEWANDGFERLHGYTIDEFRTKFGNSLQNLIDVPDSASLVTKLRNDKQSFDCTCRISQKSGEYRWLQVFITPKLNPAGQIEKFIAVEIDITAFKTKEDELNAQYRRMQDITLYLEKANAQLEVQKGEINQQKLLIELEQEKSEKLLLNILPFEVAKQLKSKGRAGTRSYKLVSVMFADFKGFSNISKNLDPKDLVSILDSYFVKFDEIIGFHYIEKIKTIGDAYMCAGGLPLSNKSNPVDAVLAGLEIQHYMNTLNDSKVLNKLPVWELRLGIHSGPVVAGVVGKKRFAYDIWGDAVNIASRMEQSGHVGMVNVSGVTYSYVKDFFDCDYRGKIETKNLGKIDMYFINRIKAEFSADKLGIVPNEVMINMVNKL